jgi:hypothetical protein
MEAPMTPDPLDDLLATSSPQTVTAPKLEINAMIADARREAPAKRRTPRMALGAGLAVLLVGATSVAVATDGFDWAPWAQDPVGAVSFTMANGFDCELRFSEYTGGSNAAFLGDVNRTLEEWYQSADVVGEASKLVPAHREEIASMAVAWDEDPAADMSQLSPEGQAAEIVNRAWAREWMAWNVAVSEVETRALTDAGYSVDDERFIGSERSGQIQCFDENHQPYVPGAGS